jgi:hypothetical protein
MAIIRSSHCVRTLSSTKKYCLFACIALIAGCSGGNKQKSATKPEAGITTQTVSASAADSNLEFFTERYLAPEERMRRRQARLDAELAKD